MRLRIALSFVLTLLCFYSINATGAEANPVAKMAGIVATINHYPNDQDRKVLQDIVDAKTTDKHTRALAQAILGMQHSVSAADKKNLQLIVDDASAEDGERKLAEILLNFNHKPSGAQKTALQAIK